MSKRPLPPAPPPPLAPWQPRARALRLLILLLGIIIPQFVLYFDSLTGKSILLPLDFLYYPRMYVPGDFTSHQRPRDIFTSDLITVFEPFRVYAAHEVRSGNLPLWNLSNYCGAPFLANNHSSLFSPFRLLDYAWPSPFSIAWGQLLRALVAGIGAYLFFRIASRVAFIPALFGAWIFPHCGFLVFWTGFPIETVGTLLPWVLLCTHLAAHRPAALTSAALALSTAVLLVAGHAANAGHILLASGFYLIFCLLSRFGFRALLSRPAIAAAVSVVAGWSLGFLLAAPQMFPTIDYLRSSFRIAARVQGDIETDPQGFSALQQIIWPYIYGSGRTRIGYFTNANLLESSAQAYVGLITCLVLAPLGWRAPGSRRLLWFWLILAVIALGQVLNLPVLNLLFPTDDPNRTFKGLFDLPPLSLLRNNRFAFITGWCILACAVAGLHALCVRRDLWRTWLLVPLALVAFIAALSLYHMFNPNPEVINTANGMRAGAVTSNSTLLNVTDIPVMLAWFSRMYLLYVAVSLAALVLWVLLARRTLAGWVGASVIGLLCLAEVVASAYGRNLQSDPSLYYPQYPILRNLAKISPQRVCGAGSFIPNMNMMMGLRDIRGYDAADPIRIVELLDLFRNLGARASPPYAVTQEFFPRFNSPLLDMLNVRAVIGRAAPPPELAPAVFVQGDDYWAWENKNLLPRAWVPRIVATIPDKNARLQALKNPAFDPRITAFVESSPALNLSDCQGTATLIGETSDSLAFELDMITDGVVVIADAYDAGWNASIDGAPATVMPANHALRGVFVPKGAKRLELVYLPFSFTLGIYACLSALIVLCGWIALCMLMRRRAPSVSPAAATPARA